MSAAGIVEINVAFGAPSSVAVSVVGAGHWMLTYDRVGPRVLELCQGRFDPAVVELCETGTAGLGLLDFMRGQQLMIIVDACLSGVPAGTVMLQEPDLSEPVGRESSVHQLGPIEALQVAKHLQPALLPERTLLALVETGGIDEETLEVACRQVVELLDEQLTPYLQRGAHVAALDGL